MIINKLLAKSEILSSAVVDSMDKAFRIIGVVSRSVNETEIDPKLHLLGKNATRWNYQYYEIKGLLPIYYKSTPLSRLR